MSIDSSPPDGGGVTPDDVARAAEAVGEAVHRTPVLSATQLGERVEATLLVKAEAFQRTGSFKPRGALNHLRSTPRGELRRGLITVTAGNHGAGLAYAAAVEGLACTVVMPEATAPSKVEAVRGYGAEVVLHGTVPEAFDRMDELREERGLHVVHPFDDPMVIAGQGTVGREVVADVPDVDVVVVPVGGGGLIAGVSTAVKGARPEARVYGVEPVGAAAMRASFASGAPVELDRVDTLIDSLAAPYAGAVSFAVARPLVEGVVTVSDEEAIAAMRIVWYLTKVYVEPAAAAPVAALLHGRIPLSAGETVVAVLSGGNLDPLRIPELPGFGQPRVRASG